MTQKSRAAILTEIGSLLADNTSQDITPSDVRSVVQDINDSFMLNTSLTRSALQALISGVTVEVNSMYTVTNAVGATKVIVVFGKTTSTISTLAINLTDNTFGSYDISGDTFTVGTSTLADVLDLGNTSGANDIVFDATYGVEFDNTSTLKEGTYDFGGSGGISRICSVGYEDMWQSGIRHVFDNSGLIRNSTNCFNIIPDNTFDNSLRFKVGSLWTLDDGTTYKCLDASTGSAVWEAQSGTFAPTVTNISPNTTSVTFQNMIYSQVGNIVTFSCFFEVGFDTGESAVTFDIDLPIASTFGDSKSIVGVMSSNSTNFTYGKVESNSSVGTVTVVGVTGSTITYIWFTGQYIVA